MSAMLSGLMALENPTPLDDSTSTVSFDGQMWLGPEQILIGVFRYYNSLNINFADFGQYFLWIHIHDLSILSKLLILDRLPNSTHQYIHNKENKHHTVTMKPITNQNKN